MMRLVCGNMGLAQAELACAMPTDGGFVLWVYKGFGRWRHHLFYIVSQDLGRSSFVLLCIGGGGKVGRWGQVGDAGNATSQQHQLATQSQNIDWCGEK
jgi:hypothetical protein